MHYMHARTNTHVKWEKKAQINGRYSLNVLVAQYNNNNSALLHIHNKTTI